MDDPTNPDPPAFTMSDKDYDEIAERIASKQKPADPPKPDPKPDPTPVPATSVNVKLTEDDHRGIAQQMLNLQNEAADKAKKDEEEKQKQKQENKENIPQAPVNLLDRSIFRIGGKRAS